MISPTRSDTEVPDGSKTAAAQATSAENDRQVLAAFDGFFHARDDDVSWVASNPLWAEYKVHADAVGGGQSMSSSKVSAARRASRVFRGLGGHFRDRYLICGDAVFVVSAKSQELVVAPLLSMASGGARATTKPLLAPALPAVKLAATARSRAQEFCDYLRRAGIEFPGGSLTAYELFFGAALHLAYSQRLLERCSPALVVVGSNHNVAARALAHAARERDVPSVYLPHAPMLRDPRLRDAPTDYVAVRGESEAAWYLDNGAEPDQVVVAGDPSLQPAPQLAPILSDAPVVFAPSPYADAVVADQVALIAAATDEDVLVTPHPRQRLDFLQAAAPGHWAFYDGSTYARLREGAAVVIQSSSGVALESLLLGIPVIELEPVGGRLYPFLDTELVPSVQTPDELAAQLDLMRTRADDREYRARLAEYARGWCSEGGKTAAESMQQLVRSVVAQGKRSRPAYDAWRPSAVDGI